MIFTSLWLKLLSLFLLRLLLLVYCGLWNTTHRLMCLYTYAPDGGLLVEGCETCRRWTSAGGSGSNKDWPWGFIPWPYFLFTFCFLSGDTGSLDSFPLCWYASCQDRLYPHGTVHQSSHSIYFYYVYLLFYVYMPNTYIYMEIIEQPRRVGFPLYYIGLGTELRTSGLMTSTSVRWVVSLAYEWFLTLYSCNQRTCFVDCYLNPFDFICVLHVVYPTEIFIGKWKKSSFF